MENLSNIGVEQQIESICDDFKEALHSNSLVNLEEYLGRLSGTWRTTLLVNLVLVEVEHRRSQGAAISIQDYIQRFPQEANEIRARLQHALDSHANIDSTVSANFDGQSGYNLRPIEQGRSVGRYRLISHLGTGGFGQVWSAQDPLLNRVVAVKLHRSAHELSGNRLDSFLAEGKRVAQLDHEGIVRVLDAGCSEGNAYIVSEFMPGGTLRETLESKQISTETAVSWIINLARALHHAHVRGFVHRDIKPSNILFDIHHSPHLADFGIAASEEELVKESPAILGTIYYMSPEQAGGESNLVDPRSDVYCLGLVLYRMLTGRLPFTASPQAEYLRQILEREPRPLRSINSLIPQPLEAICLKSLHRSINQRYASALELAETLERWQDSLRRPERSRSAVSLTAVLLALAATTFIAVVRKHESDVRLVSEAPKSSLETPEVVAWVPYDIHDEYGYDAKNQWFHFDAFGHAIFAVDTVEGEVVDLRTTLAIKHWKGLGGVFWGLSRAPDGTSRCSAIMVGRYREDHPFRVEICEFSIGPVSGGRQGVQSEAVHWWTPTQAPKGDNVTLRVDASSDKVTQIWLNEQALLHEPFLLPNEKRNLKGAVAGICGHLGEVSVFSFTAN